MLNKILGFSFILLTLSLSLQTQAYNVVGFSDGYVEIHHGTEYGFVPRSLTKGNEKVFVIANSTSDNNLVLYKKNLRAIQFAITCVDSEYGNAIWSWWYNIGFPYMSYYATAEQCSKTN